LTVNAHRDELVRPDDRQILIRDHECLDNQRCLAVQASV
jgi:hypothetical protein